MKLSAFVSEAALAQPAVLDALAEVGYTQVYVETHEPREWMVAAARRAGLQLWICIPCFSDHLDVVEQPWLRPTFRTGASKLPLEWYRGISPLDAVRVDDIARCTESAAALDPAGIVFDFIRWPVHWELEFRPDWPLSVEPADGDLPLMAEARQSTRTEAMLDTVHRNLVRFVEAARSTGRSVSLAATIVPAINEKQRNVVSQPLDRMAAIAGRLMPMLYHSMVHQDLPWIRAVLSELKRAAPSAEIIPIVQITGVGPHSGDFDWGHTPNADELADILAEIRSHNLSEVVVFMGDDISSATKFARLRDDTASLARECD